MAKKILSFALFMLCLNNATAQTENDTVINNDSVNIVIEDTTIRKVVHCGGYGVPKIFKVRELPNYLTDLTKVMFGRVAGVRVMTENGQPGIASDVKIHGLNSINGNSAPLYIVDGIIYNGDITAINIEDIATITVLKGIINLTYYGTQASNGVISITTKKGCASRYPKVSVDVHFGFNFAPQRHETINDVKTYTELGWLGLYTAGIVSGKNQDGAANFADNLLFSYYGVDKHYNPFNRAGNTLINPVTGKMFDDVDYRYVPEKWSDYLLRRGKNVSTNASISGGTEKITYYTSFGFIKDEGYLQKSDFQRINALTNFDITPVRWADINLKVAYNNSVLNNPFQKDGMNNAFLFLNLMPPIFPVFVPDTKDYDFGYGNNYQRNFLAGMNPVASLQTEQRKTTTDNLILNNSIKIKLPFKLSIISDISYNYCYSNLNEKPMSFDDIMKKEFTNNSYHHLTARQMLKYNNTFIDAHEIDIFAGHEITNKKHSSLHISEYIGQVTSQEFYDYKQANERVFAGVRYNYYEKYFFEANSSFDKSLLFSKEKRWFNSWAVGGAWQVDRENFMKSSKYWLNQLKIKFSYGVIGNDNFLMPFVAIYGGEELKREKSNVFNAGIEIYLKRIFKIEVDFYDRTISDLIFSKTVGSSSGISIIWANGGSMRNRGVDLLLSARLINTRNMTLDVRANANYNVSKMLSLLTEYRWGKYQEMITMSGIAKGHAIDEWSLLEYAGVEAETGKPLWYAYQNENGDYINDVYSYLHQDTVNGALMHPNAQLTKTVTTDYHNAGYNFTGKKASPDVFGGFGFDFDCYAFTLSATFAYQIGGYGYDNIYANLMNDTRFGDIAWHKDMLNAWNPLTGNYDTDVPRMTAGMYGYYANAASTRFLISNSALQLANLTLGYDFPRRFIKHIFLNRLNISLSCNNLLLVSHRKGYNPFTFFSASSSLQYQQGTSVHIGLKVVF